MHQKRPAALSRIVLEPKVILLAVAAGLLSGYFFRPLGAAVAPYGIIYFSLMAMCILPMMVLAIISGLGNMLRSPDTRGSFKKFILIYGLGFLVPALAGILAALIGKPGVGMVNQNLSLLGKEVLSAGQPSTDLQAPLSLLSFIGRIVPENIFAAFSQGHVISIVFISILVGLAMGLIHSPKAEEVLEHTRVGYEAFELIFAWLIYLLPIGLFCLLAGLMSRIDPVLLRACLHLSLSRASRWFYFWGCIILCSGTWWAGDFSAPSKR